MANYNFNKDIEIGEDGEKIVIRDLERLGSVFSSDNKDNKYDIILETPKGERKYEVKTDVFCEPHRDTANLFIEFECRGKKSGLEVTEADWFVTYYPYLREIWYIESQKLKELIENHDFPTTEFSGDANSNTKGYLLPRYEHKKEFIVRRVPKAWLKLN